MYFEEASGQVIGATLHDVSLARAASLTPIRRFSVVTQPQGSPVPGGPPSLGPEHARDSKDGATLRLGSGQVASACSSRSPSSILNRACAGSEGCPLFHCWPTGIAFFTINSRRLACPRDLRTERCA